MEENTLSNLVSTLIEQGKTQAILEKSIKVEDLADNGETVTKIVRKGTAFEQVDIPKKPMDRGFTFNSVASLVDYLNSDHAKDGGMVMVNEKRSYADLNVGKHVAHWAHIQHTYASELCYLLQLRSPVTQQSMRMAMRDLLRDYIENAEILAMQLSAVKVRKSSERNVRINAMNLVTRDGIDTIAMTVDTPEGEQEFALGYSWKFTGRVFDCTDKQYSFECVLSCVEKDGEIGFAIAIPTFKDVIATAVRDLAELIRAGITNPKIAVYEGE